MMEVFGLVILAFSAWCVLSRHFSDGIIAKLLLSLSAVSGFIAGTDGNERAALGAGVLLVVGVLYAYFRPTRHRPLFFDRRKEPRQTA